MVGYVEDGVQKIEAISREGVQRKVFVLAELGRSKNYSSLKDYSLVDSSLFFSKSWLNEENRFRHCKQYCQHTALVRDDHNSEVIAKLIQGKIKKLVIAINGRLEEDNKEKKRFVACDKDLSVYDIGNRLTFKSAVLNIDVREDTDYRFVGLFLKTLAEDRTFIPEDVEVYLKMPVGMDKATHKYFVGLLQASCLSPCLENRSWLHTAGHISIANGRIRAVEDGLKQAELSYKKEKKVFDVKESLSKLTKSIFEAFNNGAARVRKLTAWKKGYEISLIQYKETLKRWHKPRLGIYDTTEQVREKQIAAWKQEQETMTSEQRFVSDWIAAHVLREIERDQEERKKQKTLENSNKAASLFARFSKNMVDVSSLMRDVTNSRAT